MAHIFISYKSEQRDLALTVQHKLLEWGYETWLDVDRLKPGDQWADEIDIALKTAHACLAIMTPASISSRYVTNEWDMAIMQGKLFIPLMFHKTDPHYKYVDIQYIDFSKPDRIESFDQLKARLADYHMNSTMTTIDPYREYLQQLYDRINRYLAARLITRLRDEEGRPSPISLSINRSDDAVDVLFRKREEIDPLFAVGGLVDQSPQEFTDFIKAVEFYDGRVLLLGEPGSGKTITLLNFARDAVVKRFQDKTSPVPILGIVPTWDADKNVLLTEW